MGRIRVYLADDHPVFIKGIARLVEEDPELELVGTADNGGDALADIIRMEPDVAVLDVSMPKASGLQIVAALRQFGSQTRALLLSGSVRIDFVHSAREQGAAGYLLKTIDWCDLIEAVKTTTRSPEFISQENNGHEAQQMLTAREREILQRIAHNTPRVEIAQELNIEPSTIKAHLRRIYIKLGVTTAAAAVAEAIKRGEISLD